MSRKFKVLGINESASQSSSNPVILRRLAENGQFVFDMTVLKDLSILPHFSTELSSENTPKSIIQMVLYSVRLNIYSVFQVD